MSTKLFNYLFSEGTTDERVKSKTIERTALDLSADCGSLYDISTDSVTGKLVSHPRMQTIASEIPIVCVVYAGRTNDTEDLLKMVGIDEQMRLSIILKMVQPTGIALIFNHSKPIDQNTRFIYFRYETRIESCEIDWFKEIKSKKVSRLNTWSKYILTQIVRGIHAVVVLQLPHNQQHHLDRLLSKICQNLYEISDYHELTLPETNLLKQITSTTVYSNITPLTEKTDLTAVCRMIQKLKRQYSKHGRISYIFTPIPPQDEADNADNNTNTQSAHAIGQDFENEILRRVSELKALQYRLEYEIPEILQGKLSERIFAAQQSFAEIKKLFDNDMQSVRHVVERVRKNQAGLSDIEEALQSDVQITIENYIHQLIISLHNLTTTGNLIQQLQSDGFEYCNVGQLEINPDTNEEIVQEMLSGNNPKRTIFCATNELKQQSPDQWNRLYSQVKDEAEKHSQQIIVYADFTYRRWPLKKMTILHSKDQTLCRQQSVIHNTFSRQQSTLSLASSEVVDDCINILLLGESGVGKSTFINSFANYLHFDSLEKAKVGEPVVVIPVSFLMTTNDDFEEHLIKFGDLDPNENHNNIGQSVTQQCRCYVFQVDSGKKVRIIDTPGFADTRGDAQDEINMDMVFSFVNNLTHLNAVCLLLKPNVARLNPFLYSCFTQIFEWFGEGIRDHLIFCFTNARSTFFRLGDTGPLLRSFLKNFPVTQIPFEKRNTFCFETKPFRYLVAFQQHLKFDGIEEDEFVNSWTQSVEESQRLRTLLCDEPHSYRRNIEWQSMKDIHYQINSMLRPILEGIRNIQRNIILHEINASLRLTACCVDRVMIIDYTLDRHLGKCGDFWIFCDYLHPSSNTVSHDSRFS